MEAAKVVEMIFLMLRDMVMLLLTRWVKSDHLEAEVKAMTEM